jgi:hypothetical protein
MDHRNIGPVIGPRERHGWSQAHVAQALRITTKNGDPLGTGTIALSRRDLRL